VNIQALRLEKYNKKGAFVMKHNLCIVGYGGMGGWHADRALKSDVVNLLGVYDIKEERNQLAEKNGIRAYSSFQEVLDDKDIDIVTVATPNDVHKELAIACLAAGKHVICEKPVTLSSQDLAEMIEASNKYNRIFTVHQNRRWDIDFMAVKKLYEGGQIGDIFNIESRIHGSRGIPSDWRGMKEYGGGMLYDWGVHLIDQILQIYVNEKLVSVYCEFDHISNKEVDDGFKLTLKFDNGARAYIEVGTYNFIPLPRFYVQGKKGTGIITDWREPLHIVECTHWHESEVLPVETAAGLTKTMAPRDEITTKTYNFDKPHSDVHDFYRNICDAIEGKATQYVTHEEMMKVMKTIEAAFESVERKATVYL
jgi:scyllo-inositol 2-dehydrogenase (NADP+)